MSDDLLILLTLGWILCGLAAGRLLMPSKRYAIGCLLGGIFGPAGLVVAAILRLEYALVGASRNYRDK